MAKIPKYLLNLAGEYRICSELNKRGVFATITYGNRKGVDVYAISDRKERALKIEVKTAQQGKFVTSITQKGLDKNRPDSPDFWVLFQILPGQNATFEERFFILTHEEICGVQKRRNNEWQNQYFKRHGKRFHIKSKGVDQVKVKDVEPFEDQWAKIIKRFGYRITVHA